MHEFSIVQNNAIAALAIQCFVKEFYKHKNEESGVPFPLLMPILPLVFNDRCCKCLVQIKRVTSARFLTTLSEFRDIPAGLQERMVGMSDQTFKAINLALSVNLISLRTDTGELFPVKNIRYPKIQYGLNQEVFHAARILGNWFANYSVEEICVSLNIVF